MPTSQLYGEPVSRQRGVGRQAVSQQGASQHSGRGTQPSVVSQPGFDGQRQQQQQQQRPDVVAPPQLDAPPLPHEPALWALQPVAADLPGAAGLQLPPAGAILADAAEAAEMEVDLDDVQKLQLHFLLHLAAHAALPVAAGLPTPAANAPHGVQWGAGGLAEAGGAGCRDSGLGGC